MKKNLLFLVLLALVGAAPRVAAQDAAPAENIVFPANAGVIDVTAAPYSADNTGVADATAAIQQAINVARGFLKGKTVYLPNGTYRLTNRLVFTTDQALHRTLTFQGQSRENTILKFDDNLAAAAANLPIIKCFEPATSTQTFTNSMFSTNIANLTLDIGAGNPGGVGINYVANNQSYIRNVLIRSSDPAKVGRNGIELITSIPGPALLKNVTVDGFNLGIRGSLVQYGLTLENITLRNQVQFGLSNNAQTFSIRHLLSENTVPAINQVSGSESTGIITLIDSQLNGGDPANYGINLVNGFLFARNVTSTGYAGPLNAYGTPVAGSSITEYVSATATSGPGAAVSLQSPKPTSLNLPIRETPEPPRDPVSTWKSVGDTYLDAVGVSQPGAVPGDGVDDTAAIQAALNSGASTIYFPNSKNVAFTSAANITQEDTGARYSVSGTLVVGPEVTRIIGLGTGIQPTGSFSSNAANLPIFQFVNTGTRRTIVLENFRTASNNSRCVFIEQASMHTLVLRNLSIRNGYGYRNTGTATGVGDVFMEDFHVLPTGGATPYTTTTQPGFYFKNQRVWARQLNPEQCTPNIINDGGTVWILGLKTEFPNTLIKTLNDGETEVLGGLALPARPTSFADGQNATAVEHPTFVNDNSSMSVAGFGEVRTNSAAPTATAGNVYLYAVAETRGTGTGATTAFVTGASLPQRKSQPTGSTFTSFVLPLYTGYLTPTPLPVELTRFTAERVGPAARLDWATASEKNSAGFAVEASADGREFRRLGWVAGQGNSSLPSTYRFEDPSLARYAAAVVYYRLRQRDLDGTESFSPVRAVPVPTDLASAPGLSAWPNPAAGRFALTGAPAGTAVQVYDGLGRLVLSATMPEAGALTLQLPATAGPGVYLARAGRQRCRLVVE